MNTYYNACTLVINNHSSLLYYMFDVGYPYKNTFPIRWNVLI